MVFMPVWVLIPLSTKALSCCLCLIISMAHAVGMHVKFLAGSPGAVQPCSLQRAHQPLHASLLYFPQHAQRHMLKSHKTILDVITATSGAPLNNYYRYNGMAP